MKRLLFLRHAKSDWAADGTGDHERPLAKRGLKAARRIGRFLVTSELRPEVAVSSTAVRAHSTLVLAAEAGGWSDVAVHTTDALYEATPDAALAVVRALPDEANTALLVGHEPTFSVTVGRLIGAASIDMPTAALACVDLEVEHWADVSFGTGTLCGLVVPKMLKGLGLKQAAARANGLPDEGPDEDETAL